MEVSNLKDISGSEFKKYIKNSYNEMSILEFNNLLNFISYNCNSYNELLKFEELLGIYLMSDKKIESYVSVFDAYNENYQLIDYDNQIELSYPHDAYYTPASNAISLENGEILALTDSTKIKNVDEILKLSKIFNLTETKNIKSFISEYVKNNILTSSDFESVIASQIILFSLVNKDVAKALSFINEKTNYNKSKYNILNNLINDVKKCILNIRTELNTIQKEQTHDNTMDLNNEQRVSERLRSGDDGRTVSVSNSDQNVSSGKSEQVLHRDSNYTGGIQGEEREHFSTGSVQDISRGDGSVSFVRVQSNEDNRSNQRKLSDESVFTSESSSHAGRTNESADLSASSKRGASDSSNVGERTDQVERQGELLSEGTPVTNADVQANASDPQGARWDSVSLHESKSSGNRENSDRSGSRDGGEVWNASERHSEGIGNQEQTVQRADLSDGLHGYKYDSTELSGNSDAVSDRGTEPRSIPEDDRTQSQGEEYHQHGRDGDGDPLRVTLHSQGQSKEETNTNRQTQTAQRTSGADAGNASSEQNNLSVVQQNTTKATGSAVSDDLSGKVLIDAENDLIASQVNSISESDKGSSDIVRGANCVLADDPIVDSNVYKESRFYNIPYPNERLRNENNMSALRLLKQLDDDKNFNLTDEQKKVLSSYSGFGGFSSINDRFWDDKTQEAVNVHDFISESEFTDLENSKFTAYYTHTAIIDSMYKKLEEFGFNKCKILEPSCGSGKFIGRLPASMRDSEVTAVELDPLTARIASHLYPQAKVRNMGFEDTTAENYYDVAVGNVPFGQTTVWDSKNPDLAGMSIHNYFFAKALKEVRPNGVVAFITSSYTLDATGIKAKLELAKKAKFLGAVRLPNCAFGSSATDVVSDIIFLQKRERELTNEEIDFNSPEFEWINSDKVILNNYVSEDNEPAPEMADKEHPEVSVNRYFLNHPEQVLGQLHATSTAFGFKPTVTAHHKDVNGNFKITNHLDTNIIEDLNKALDNVKTESIENVDFVSVSDKAFDIDDPAFKTAKKFSYYVSATGELMYKYLDHLEPEPAKQSAPKQAVILKLIALRDLYSSIRNMELNGQPLDEIAPLRAKMTETYDDLRSKHLKKANDCSSYCKNATGDKAVLEYLINNYLNIDDDASFTPLTYLEKTDDKGNFIGKNDIFERPVLYYKAQKSEADTIDDALIMSINYHGQVDIPYMTNLLKKQQISSSEIVKYLVDNRKIYRDPEQIKFENDKVVPYSGYVTEDEYLSGDIYKKIDVLNEFINSYDATYLNYQLDDLNKIIPEKLDMSEINVEAGAQWIEPKFYTQFINELTEQDRQGDILYDSNLGIFETTNDPKYVYGYKARTEFAFKDNNAVQLYLKILNHESLKVTKSIIKGYDADGKAISKTVIDEEATAQQKAVCETISSKFKEWIWSDPERRDYLVDFYNRRFNAIKTREYNGELFTFNGINPNIKLRPHQKNAVARSLLGGNSLFAHEVGAGKTFAMCASAMEKIRLGMAHKALFVLPKPVLKQFYNEFLTLYPNADILLANDKSFNTVNRNKFLQRVAYGDQNIILMSKEQFEKISLSDSMIESYLKSEIATAENSLRNLDKSKKSTEKAIKKSISFYNAKLNKLIAKDADQKDNLGFSFEDLGCDALYVDEAHNYKGANSFCTIDGVAPPEPSNLAFDMQMKAHYLNQKYDNKAIVFATGTPISNSVIDFYTMQSYLNMPALKKAQVNNLNAFISNFGSIESKIEINSAGELQNKVRLRAFKNIPDAVKIFSECADIITQDNFAVTRSTYDNLKEQVQDNPEPAESGENSLGNVVILPEPHYHYVECEASEFQEQYIQEIANRAYAVQQGTVDRTVDNMLKLSMDGRKISLDPRIVEPNAPDDPNLKVNKCAENIKEVYDKNPNSAQLVFCDLGTPNKDGSFSVYDELKKKLVFMGFKDEEVAFIHDYKDDEKKVACFEAVNKGEIKVLIGSTAKLGTGVNVQKSLKAVHHLDINWRPSDIKQRNGRIIRQGNKFDEVDIYSYITKGSYDAFMYQTVEMKSKYIDQIMKGNKKIRNIELDDDNFQFDYTTCKAVALKDDRYLDLAKMEDTIKNLKAEQKGFLDRKKQFENSNTKELPNKIKVYENSVEILKSAKETIVQHSADKENDTFKIELNGKVYNDKVEAGKELLHLVACISSSNNPVHIGSFCGLDMYATKTISVLNDPKTGKVRYVNNLIFSNYADPNRKIYQDLALGDSGIGNLSRIVNLINNTDKIIQEAEKKITEFTEQLESQKQFLKDNPEWSKLSELNQLEADMKKLQAEIDADFEAKKNSEETSSAVSDNYEGTIVIDDLNDIDANAGFAVDDEDVAEDDYSVNNSDEFNDVELSSVSDKDCVYTCAFNKEYQLYEDVKAIPDYGVWQIPIKHSNLWKDVLCYRSLEDIDAQCVMSNKEKQQLIYANADSNSEREIENVNAVKSQQKRHC